MTIVAGSPKWPQAVVPPSVGQLAVSPQREALSFHYFLFTTVLLGLPPVSCVALALQAVRFSDPRTVSGNQAFVLHTPSGQRCSALEDEVTLKPWVALDVSESGDSLG